MEEEKELRSQVTNINVPKLKNVKLSKISKKNLGKGKASISLGGILIGAATVFERLRELPGFNYLKAVEIGKLTTWFNQKVADLQTMGINDKTAYQQALTNASNGIGRIFSLIVEYTFQHPTEVAVEVVVGATLLSLPFKMLLKKIREVKLNKGELEEKITRKTK